MKTITAQANGKLMIAGEYAVLFGYPALVAAVPYLASSTFSQASVTELLTKPIDISPKNLFSSVINACSNANLCPLTGRYHIDTSAFFDERGHKLGLGSSAAAIVSLTKLILLQHGIENREFLLRLSLKAHRDFSCGLGSGADVAASVFGKTIRFLPQDPLPLVDHLDLRETKEQLFFVATNRSQDSRPFVKEVLALNQKDPVFIKEFCQTSSLACERLQNSSNKNALVMIIDELFHNLKTLGLRAKIDIVSSVHEEIYRCAKAFGGSAKPSGAGGGDFSMVILPKENQKNFMHNLHKKMGLNKILSFVLGA